MREELVVFCSFMEWENPSNHDKENNPDAEDVDLLTVVNFAQLDLWGHVSLGTPELIE